MGVTTMSQENFRLKSNAMLMVAIAAAYPVAGYCAPAARIDFAVGNVTAIAPNGQQRSLAKGAQLNEGETVNTNNGRAQLRFTDGAYVSLQPESQFRIDQYKFDGKTDGSEKGLFSLLKGGLRTITGLVGRTNKQNYQVNTTVATIGIRGTEYTIQYGKSISGTVGDGEIQVCNSAGCLNVTNGESYYVEGQGVKPELSNKVTDLPPPPPSNPPTYFATGENRNPDGSPIIIPIIPNPLVGTVDNLSIAVVDASNNVDTAKPVRVTLDALGAMSSFVASSSGLLDVIQSGDAAITGAPVNGGGNDRIIAWGVALGGVSSPSLCCLSAGEAFHYVVGFPTLDTEMVNLSANNMVGTYSFLGATTPTIFGSVAGSVTGGSFTANFGSGSVFTQLNLAVAGISGLTLIGSGTMFGSQFDGNMSANCSNCVSTSGTFAGFFAGINAARAGLTYNVFGIQNDSGVFIGTLAGAATFKQASLSPAPAAGILSRVAGR